MQKLRSILAAVDTISQNRAVLARAAELARAHDAKLTIVHISDVPVPPGAVAADQQLVQEQALILDQKRVEEEIGSLDLSDISVTIRVESGSPPSRIVEIANELHVDLIVMRAHQRRSFREKLIGSTADRVLRSTSSSVLIVKRPVEHAYRNVFVAIDFLDDSESAAIRSADIFPDIKLVLVHVIEVTARFERALANAGYGDAKVKAFKRQAARYVDNRMRDLLTRVSDRKPAPRSRVLIGDPAQSLVQVSRNAGTELIAVGSAGYSAIRLALLGSVTQRLIREADSDVLISRTPAPTIVK